MYCEGKVLILPIDTKYFMASAVLLFVLYFVFMHSVQCISLHWLVILVYKLWM